MALQNTSVSVVDDQAEAISEILSVFHQWEKENYLSFVIDTTTAIRITQCAPFYSFLYFHNTIKNLKKQEE